MRQALAMGATLLLVGVGVVPASAGQVSLTDACQRTRDALSTTGGTVAGAQVAAFTGLRFSHGGRIVDAATGTYGLIKADGLRPKDLKAARKYLAAPGLTAWRNAGRFYTSDLGWSASYDQARNLAIGLPDDCASAAATLVSNSGNTYQYANADVEVDDSGRIVQWSAGAQQWRFGFAPQTVNLPSSPAPYAEWQRASQAAALNSTLRTICRTVASTVDPDPAAIDQALRTYPDPARAVPLKVRTLREGSLIYARNPYLTTYHAWRVYLKSGEAVARRVAP